jgi:hypothetical protein
MLRYSLLMSVLFFTFCRNKSSDEQLVMVVDKISLRAAPGIESPVVAVLQLGDRVVDLGEVSHFETELIYENVAQRTPWIKVVTVKNQRGWVFAGAVNAGEKMEDWLLKKRFECYFGHEFTNRLRTWMADCSTVQTAGALAVVYRRGIALRDSMAYLLGRRSEPAGMPDYGWMDGGIPGFVYQAAFDGGPPHLFVDYLYWGEKAQKTSGTADDEFVQVCFAVFPQDSIESFFPVWKFQLSETASASQFGTGMHLNTMRLLDKSLSQSRLFEPELWAFKDALLDDIHDPINRYWQPRDRILKELDGITIRPPGCLSVSEINALRVRRNMFEHPEMEGIIVNMRSGE